MLPFPSAMLGQAASASVSDPNFSSVKLLMGFEGANGSTSFVDESASPHTMTANGNAQITTAQHKIGLSAAAFDGSGDFISTPDSPDWGPGAGAFTGEGFFRFQTKQDSQAIMGQWDNTGAVTNCAWYFFIVGGVLTLRTAAGSVTLDVGAAFAPTLGSWYHLAFDRDAADNKLRIYRDGAMVVSGTNAHNINNSTGSMVLGRIGTGSTFSAFDFNGNMDEVRWTPGVARYKSDSGFIVPTSAYPRS
jgi:hypothetical protein